MLLKNKLTGERYYCYGIVKQNGGHIEVDSEVGKGTTFQMFFPSSAQEAEILPEDQGREARPSGNETILVVEDEPMIRSMCSRVLSDNGYNALEASNGEEALRLTETHPVGMIDLLVTDVVMPRMGGIELARCLRESRPEIKILVTSGYTDDNPLCGLSLNAEWAYLRKPFMPSDLLGRVREVLSS